MSQAVDSVGLQNILRPPIFSCVLRYVKFVVSTIATGGNSREPGRLGFKPQIIRIISMVRHGIYVSYMVYTLSLWHLRYKGGFRCGFVVVLLG